MESLTGWRRVLASVNSGPLWQVAQVPSKTTFPRAAAAWSKLPAGGVGAEIESWQACSAGSLLETRSSVPLVTETPVRGSEKEPWPPICVTATYRFQYAISVPSPVAVIE